MKALDGRRDLLISCGSGKDSLAADASDPKARDCEARHHAAAGPKADLSVTLDRRADPVVEGDAVEYRFRVDNAGPNPATGVTVATTLPADATVAPASGCSQAGAVVTCSLGDVPSGGSATGALTVRYGSTGDKTVTSTRRLAGRGPRRRQRHRERDDDGRGEARPSGADLSVSVSAGPARRRSLQRPLHGDRAQRRAR